MPKSLTETELGALRAAAVDCAVPNCVALYLVTLRKLANRRPALVRLVHYSDKNGAGNFYRITRAGRRLLTREDEK